MPAATPKVEVGSVRAGGCRTIVAVVSLALAVTPPAPRVRTPAPVDTVPPVRSREPTVSLLPLRSNEPEALTVTVAGLMIWSGWVSPRVPSTVTSPAMAGTPTLLSRSVPDPTVVPPW